jgi:hypothetical protein
MNIHFKRVCGSILLSPILLLFFYSPIGVQKYALSRGFDIQDAYLLGNIPILLFLVIGYTWLLSWMIETTKEDKKKLKELVSDV